VSKEVYLSIGEHPTVGKILLFESPERIAEETNTSLDDWEITSGWVPVESVAGIGVYELALASGALKVRDAP
jgi:hypothetical protein